MSSRGLLGCVLVCLACGGTIDPTALPDASPDQLAPPNDGGVPVPQLMSNKVDILFAIDNSRSMGDKQALLAQAVPNVIAGFLSGKQFPAVTDMHIGIVSSSLGGGGAEQTGGQPICAPNALEPVFNKYNSHNDDKGRLINRVKPKSANGSGAEDTVAHAVPTDGNGGNFLAWLPAKTPTPNVPPETDQTALMTDFQTLIIGTQEYGCGLEAQLESWYRFLVQPDPYDALLVNPDPNGGPPKTVLTGTDATVIKQRHDFLRNDSVVIVVQVTDEEDSWTDPLAIGGRGWVTRTTTFPGSPTNLMPRGTSACDSPIDPNNPSSTGPSDPNCTSCGFAGNLANGTPISSDPNCTISCGVNCVGYYTAKDDNLNVRYVNDMKRRYGIAPQFPIERYVDGLTSVKVPNRDGEHPNGAGNYVGNKNCLNPLFAKTLPTDPNDASLCDGTAQPGPRNSSLVYYLHVGGVPPNLIADGGTPKATLSANDWAKIIGKSPGYYDYTGIDPHMIESTRPRTAANQSGTPYLSSPLPDITAADNADPINGREWDTTLSPFGLDLEYACTFPLLTPKECTDPANVNACECVKNAVNPGGPPLCAAGASGKSLQVRGKAYPTIRELRVAQGMGNHGVVGSLCTPTDPFTPAFSVLGARLASVIVK